MYIIYTAVCIRPIFLQASIYRQVSLVEADPDAGVSNWRLGSDSQVTVPLALRMYLYWKRVYTGIGMVTICKKGIRDPILKT